MSHTKVLQTLCVSYKTEVPPVAVSAISLETGGGNFNAANRYVDVKYLGRLVVTTFLTGEKFRESPEGAPRKLFWVAQDLPHSASRPRLVNQNLFFVQWLVATLLLALGNGVVSWGTPPMSSRVLQLYVGENDGGGSLTCISAILGTYAYIQ